MSKMKKKVSGRNSHHHNSKAQGEKFMSFQFKLTPKTSFRTWKASNINKTIFADKGQPASSLINSN